MAARSSSDTMAARVETFSPQGYVRQVRQVRAHFSAPMVSLGDVRLAAPFTVDCPAEGRGRWADPTDWVYDFASDLGGGINCQFTLKPGLKSLAGAAVSAPAAFAFNTGGPTILASYPRSGSQQLDENQVFLLRLNAPATSASVAANAYCAVDGIVERIPVRILTGQARQAVLAQRRVLGYGYTALLLKSGEYSIPPHELPQREQQLTLVQCERQLPPATRVLLHWGAGIATPSGLLTRSDQQLAFRVRPAFTAQVECTRSNPRAGCIPMLPLRVRFTAPVPRAMALAVRLRTAAGELIEPRIQSQAPTIDGVNFPGPFAATSTVTVLLPDQLVDDAGRPLQNAARFPLPVQMDVYPPLVKFSAPFGILEAREGGILPVTLRNIAAAQTPQPWISARMLRVEANPKAIADWLMRVQRAAQFSGRWVTVNEGPGQRPRRVMVNTTGTTSVFRNGDAARAFRVRKNFGPQTEEVVGIPLKHSGFYVVELASDVLGAALSGHAQTRYVSTSALVTNLAVHFKWGRESSLIWVTRLNDAAPVADADVSINDSCTGQTLWHGRTNRDGIATALQTFGQPGGYGGCPAVHPLLVLARLGGDFSFTETTWDQGITPYDFGLRTDYSTANGIYHTVLDRSLFQAGETVSMKHFIRAHVSQGIAIPADAGGMHQIVLVHQGSGQEYRFSIPFDAGGIGVSNWEIPPGAKLGDYLIRIDGHESGGFKVEQFRLPTMRASVSGPARALVSPHTVDLDLHVAYLSGGSAGGLPVKLRTLVEPLPQHFADYPDYRFGGDPVREGITSDNEGPLDSGASEASAETTRTQTIPLVLDASGSARVSVANLPRITGPARLLAELEYPDASGETLTRSGYVQLLPAAISVGIRPDSWIGSPGHLHFRVVALDVDGKPVPGQAISVSLYQANDYSYRKRLLGGFYSYETTHEVKRLGASCSGRTDAQGLLSCDIDPGASGQILVRAETRDAQGNLAGATTSMYVYDKDAWWFGGTSGDRMDVLPEKQEYDSGQTASFQVRMPFRAATALVTVEREGILSSFVTHLKGNAPIVRIPIEPGYAPDVFVSVLAVRGRVRHAAPGAAKPGTRDITGLVDLTKPAYRLGTTEIRVGWRPHRLMVDVEPQQKVYRIRDQVAVRIHVRTADGHPLPPGGEVAIAAVDEALLDLGPNPSWKLLDAMMNERALEVWTSTAQMQVVGKRHYGRKAVPAGGGGGRELDRARNLFNSLLFWRPRVPLDAQGDATVSIPLNDSLSSFRIVAIADSGPQLYGTGAASISTTQDLILLSGLPPLVREADRYAATFTVRNTTDHQLVAQIQPSSPQLPREPGAQTVRIAPGEARDLSWTVTVPVGVNRLDWDVRARNAGGTALDHLQVSEAVAPAVPVRTYQATLTQLTAPLSMPVQLPRGAIPHRGGLQITLHTTLADALAGVRDYMSRYPYNCLEQLASRAVALGSHSDWDALMQRLPSFIDADGLLKYFPTEELQGDDGLTAYVLSIANAAGWPLQKTEQDRLLQALTLFVQGKITRDSALPTADLTIRKLQAIDALARYGAARPDMLDSLNLDPNLMPTSALLDWIDVLGRVPGVPQVDDRSRQAFSVLRARLNYQGTMLGFSTQRSDDLWWLMVSGDSNANRLLLEVLGRPDWTHDVPRLVRGTLARQHRGHWDTTVANAWGTLAMQKFSRQFESTPVSGTTTVRYGREQHRTAWPQPGGSALIDIPWQSGTGVLAARHDGTGAPWIMVQATAALPLTQALSSGFTITRQVTAIEQHQPGTWSRGDVERIHLDLDAQSDMSWVVVDDPIPAGATIVGGGLGGQSALLQRGEQQSGTAWLAFEERRNDSFRAYYRFVPKGHWSIDYTVRLNNPGTYQLPATRVEAMYAPEMFGELPNTTLTVLPPGNPP
jgi:uncharacterized protein YfaS (alpha-2-macroglobulin family)